MKIEAVDWFYLSMPEVQDIADGSQDALLVRVQAGGLEGWGECEAAPLVSIASWCCPMSHAACKPLRDSVLGQRIDDPADIARIGRLVREQSLDLLQTPHTLSGIDIALWDLLGRRLGEPVWRLLGYPRAHPKTPYASSLFGDTPHETHAKALRVRTAGYRAAKFGWGPYGHGGAAEDAAHVRAAREGLGEDAALMVDAGTVWGDDPAPARERLAALREARVLWLEEPFVSGALEAYAALSREAAPVKLAGGEGCHSVHMARHLLNYGALGFVQIDAGRIGGITPAKAVADLAAVRGVTYVNHTFTSHLALSASLQPYAGLAEHTLCEYPVEASPVAVAIAATPLRPDAQGYVHAPEGPGLGVTVHPARIRPYLVEAELRVGGHVLYRTPDL
jgi:L-alanine-DL-glutamate epimerase-like enolase superfamily enzyme